MDERGLIEKLRRIEALHAGATTDGERAAAGAARQRILDRLRSIERVDPVVEYTFTLPDPWKRKVFMAMLRRYGIRPYRYKRQRHATVMARVSRSFVDQTLWPEFQEISRELETYLEEVTSRIIAEAIHGDTSDADETAALDHRG